MLKRILLFSLLLVFLTASNKNAFAQTGCQPCVRPGKSKPNMPSTINNVTASKNRILLLCEPGTENCAGDQTVNTTTSATDPENDVPTYQYSVSGGRIIGSGANVKWDLSGAAPGTYKATVGVDDGCGVCTTGTVTETVVIEACKIGDACSQSWGALINSKSEATGVGQKIVLNAEPEVRTGAETYTWIVNGKILAGQTSSQAVILENAEIEGKNIEVQAVITSLINQTTLRKEFKTNFIIAPQPRRDLIVFIKNKDGQPLADATVEIYDAGTPLPATNQRNGNYVIISMRAKRKYRIRASREGYSPFEDEIDFTMESPTTPIEVTLKN